uniref:Protein aurora borealis n=1 Tax=Angiostrongylus cantonensis TaxID=6313 RepID=A0A0K0DDF8_ANGCA
MSGRKNVNSPFHNEISVGRTLGCTVKEKELIHVPRQNLQNLNLPTEDPRNTGVSPWFRESLDELHSAMVKPSCRHPENLVDDENPSHLTTICSEALAQENGELKRWIPPEIPPNYESVIDIKHEKPSGRACFV